MTHPQHAHPMRGMLLIMLAVFMFSSMDTLAKHMLKREAYPISPLIFARYGVHLLFMLALLAPRMGLDLVRTRHPGLQVLRGLLLVGSTGLFYLSLIYLPLAEAAAISFVGPVLVAALSGPLLRERIGRRQWAAIGLGFVGVLIMLDPWGIEFHVMSLIVLGATFCYALSTVMLRLLSRHDSDVVALFWLSLATSAASLVGAVPVWVWPTPLDWIWLVVMGLLGGIAQILNTRAWRLATTAVLAPFDYTSIVLAVLFGYLWFKEEPSWMVWFGLPLVIGSGLYILHRERIRARQQALVSLP